MSTPNTRYGSAELSRMLSGCRSVFFIGIGGISMSSLAEITAMRGIRTGGSDRADTELTRRLEEKGIEIFHSHEASHIDGYDAVVYTIAISPDNPEYTAARLSGRPCVSRADYLGFVMNYWPVRIGISGMHGKSTTTSMCGQVFSDCGTDPTVLCGAVMPAYGAGYVIGRGRYMIFEACEYMDSFLDFNPTVAVVLNVEMDHVDYFGSMAQIRRSFANFASIPGPGGTVIANWDDENVRLAVGNCPGNLVRFSTAGHREAEWQSADIDISRGLPSFTVLKDGNALARIDLDVPGRHNVSNALAAFICAYCAGIPADEAAVSLSAFTGVARRMQFRGKLNGADVYEDYAHHPTEISATLTGVRDMGYDRVVCAFQPHTYSRTAGLFDDFAAALRLADEVYLCDIYAARERETFGVSSEKLARAVGDRAVYCGSFESTAESLRQTAGERTAVVVMGAGDIFRVIPLLGLGNG
jgi:UDP-N-acetylmuramate--alanine ligase